MKKVGSEQLDPVGNHTMRSMRVAMSVALSLDPMSRLQTEGKLIQASQPRVMRKVRDGRNLKLALACRRPVATVQRSDTLRFQEKAMDPAKRVQMAKQALEDLEITISEAGYYEGCEEHIDAGERTLRVAEKNLAMFIVEPQLAFLMRIEDFLSYSLGDLATNPDLLRHADSVLADLECQVRAARNLVQQRLSC